MPRDEMNEAVDNGLEAMAAELMAEQTESEVTVDDTPETEETVEETPAEETETTEVEEDSEETVEESEEETSEETNEESKPEKPDKKQSANQAFAQMRTENKAMKDTLSLAANLAGMTVEDYMKHLSQQQLEADAKKAELPPEVYQRLQSLEQDRNQREQELRNLHFQNRVRDFTQKEGLSQDELRGFIDSCFEKGIYPHELPDVDLSVLYRGLNHDKLVEAERQSWIEKSSKNKQGASVPGSGKGKAEQTSSGEIKSYEDFEAAFAEADFNQK